ncbi:ABC transporter permease family protein [Planctomicrobium piriforme]|uniref:ABC-2 family transporter protein n=1 Tax=Planctomicrobium piriforme TaxID=1576369 RepID=A0A1I3NGX9_9PLAN|nr:ABC transporter permease subunit [Planctomicrobium piriforme]SFJ08439.1 ABC-2 family transporter protein [Planctomicrobium piriforme]
MIGQTLALVRRALRVDVRNLRSHLFRGALAALLLFFLFSTHQMQLVISAPGQTLFSWIAYTNYWFITLAGVSIFASAITEEKEEQTLGLLRMANISGLSVLLGKWIPRLIGAMLLIAVQVPFTALAVTLGGVMWNQITATYLTLLAHLFFVGNVGLLCSVVMPRTGAACGLGIILLLVIYLGPFIVPPLCGLAVNGTLSSGWPPPPGTMLAGIYWTGEQLGRMNALGSLFEILQTTFADHWTPFQVVSNFTGGLVFFGLSWLLYEPCTRNEVEPSAESGAMRWLRRVGRKKDKAGPRAWSHALVWKDFQYLAGGSRMTVIKFVVYGLAIFGLAMISVVDRGTWQAKEIAGIGFWTASMVMLVELPLITTRLYRNEITQKTWSVLMTLPQSLPEVAYAKLGGGLLALAPAVAWMGISALFLGDEILDFFWQLLKEPAAILGFGYGVLQLLMGIQLATWLSVAANWAIWPVAIFTSGFIVFMGNMLVVTCLSATLLLVVRDDNGTGVLAVMCLGALTLNVVLHLLVRDRLKRAAAD